MLAVLDKKKLLEYIQNNGPVLPSQLVGPFSTNTIMIGATFSEMVKEKSIAVSHAKVGSSPVYYVKGQEEKLSMLYKYLNEKDQRTYDLLKEKKVLRESEQTPLVRVSLNNLKDFAHPLQVTAKGKDEIFWKWYLLTQEEAIPYIKELLEKTEKKVEQKKEEQKQESVEQKTTQQEIKPEQPKRKELEKQPPVVQQTLDQDISDPYMKKIQQVCREKNITLTAIKMVKKNAEYELFITLPTAIGEIQYYAKAKIKKKINEGDLATLYLEAERKKLPALLIIPGTLAKKVQDKLAKEFINMKVLSM